MNIKSPSLNFIPQTRNSFAPQKNSEKSSPANNKTQDQTKITISQAARDALTSPQNQMVEEELTRIKALEPQRRTDQEKEFLVKNDEKLVGITEKLKKGISLSADETEYEETLRGYVPTMKNLTNHEKSLYDELIDKGNTSAAGAVKFIGLRRAVEGHAAGGSHGTTFDAISTAITPENIKNLFTQAISDPTGDIQKSFQALSEYLKTRPIA